MAPKQDKMLLDKIGNIPPGAPAPGDIAAPGPAIAKAPAAPPIVKTPAPKPEPPDNTKVISEVKDLLTQAMDKLSSIGGAPEVPKVAGPPVVTGSRPPLGIKGGGY